MKPASQVIDHSKKKITIPSVQNFIQMHCASVKEARNRATVLAYLTYNMRLSLFVELCTAEMLCSPLAFQTLEEIHAAYNFKDIEQAGLIDEPQKEINLQLRTY